MRRALLVLLGTVSFVFSFHYFMTRPHPRFRSTRYVHDRWEL